MLRGGGSDTFNCSDGKHHKSLISKFFFDRISKAVCRCNSSICDSSNLDSTPGHGPASRLGWETWSVRTLYPCTTKWTDIRDKVHHLSPGIPLLEMTLFLAKSLRIHLKFLRKVDFFALHHPKPVFPAQSWTLPWFWRWNQVSSMNKLSKKFILLRFIDLP